MIAFLAAAFLVAASLADVAQSATIEAKPQSLGRHHCHELQSKSAASSASNKLTFVYDLGDAGRVAYDQGCVARGGVPSRGRCPRTNAIFVCVGDAKNATAYTILYQGSADLDLLKSACRGGATYGKTKASLGLRDLPGRTIWGSCLVE